MSRFQALAILSVRNWRLAVKPRIESAHFAVRIRARPIWPDD